MIGAVIAYQSHLSTAGDQYGTNCGQQYFRNHQVTLTYTDAISPVARSDTTAFLLVREHTESVMRSEGQSSKAYLSGISLYFQLVTTGTICPREVSDFIHDLNINAEYYWGDPFDIANSVNPVIAFVVSTSVFLWRKPVRIFLAS